MGPAPDVRYAAPVRCIKPPSGRASPLPAADDGSRPPTDPPSGRDELRPLLTATRPRRAAFAVSTIAGNQAAVVDCRAWVDGVGGNVSGASRRRFERWEDGVGVAELSRLARTVRAWEAEILAWHTTDGCSSGPTEAMNLLIKKVKGVGHGFRNFANNRLRLLLYCVGRWQIHQTAGLRSRTPRLRV
jgi:hypothetical protein